MRRALAINESNFGPDHPKVATTISNLSSLLQATNRLPEAEQFVRRALAIDEATFGPDHPRVAIRLNNLATLLRASNRSAEAEPYSRRQLYILFLFHKRSGYEHHYCTQAIANYTRLLKALNHTEAQIADKLAEIQAEVDAE
jgi:hypothetical protein